MKVLKHILPLLALRCLVSHGQATDWHVGAEVSYANLSGVRAYEASNNDNRNESKDLLVPSLLVSRTMGDRSELLLRYTLYDSIDGLGWASDSDIFGENKGARPAITPYRIEEEMREFTLSYLYRVASRKNLSLRLGPNLSLYDSEADFFTGEDLNVHRRSFSNTDLAIGAEANATIKFSERMRAEFTYRFSNPPGRDIHLLSLALKFKL